MHLAAQLRRQELGHVGARGKDEVVGGERVLHDGQPMHVVRDPVGPGPGVALPEGRDPLRREGLAPDHEHHIGRHHLELAVEPAQEVAAPEAGQEAGARGEVEAGDGLAQSFEGALPLGGVRIERVVVGGDDQDPHAGRSGGSRNCRSWSRW